MSKLLALGDNDTLSELQQVLQAAGHELYQYNPIEIIPLPWPNQTAIHWENITKIIVISKAACQYGLALAEKLLPIGCQIFTIGAKTAQAAAKLGFKHISYPGVFNSIALLQLATLQDVANESIVVFKGLGGLTQIEEQLTARGAHCQVIHCYQRQARHQDLTEHAKNWKNYNVNKLLITSLESFEAFLNQLPKDSLPWLADLHLIVTSERLEKALHMRGFKHVSCCHNFSVTAIIEHINNAL